LGSLVQAGGVSSASAASLMSMLQSSEDGEETAAPAAAVYESQSGGIASAMDNLLEKAEDQLSEARKTETEAIHAYELKKQSLDDSIKFATKDLSAAKSSLAAAEEKKATAEGELTATKSDLAEDSKDLEETEHSCLEKAEAYEEEKKSRAEELKALTDAKKVISEATTGAESLAYGLSQVSLLQTSENEGSGTSRSAVNIVRRLAFAHHSPALAQLTTRLESADRAGGFDKVKALISDMIDKLEEEAGAEASEKAFCDKEMKETAASKEEATTKIEKLTTKIDQQSSASSKLKEEVATLSKELVALAKSQAEMDKLRKEESENFAKSKAEMDQGIEGVKLAVKILQDYYAAKSDEGSGGGSEILGLLEVCESDFTKLLATMTAEEERAAAEYTTLSKENELTKVTKEKDVEFKTKEAASLDNSIAELSSDKGKVEDFLDGVLEYEKKLQEQCVAKAETYEERTARRAAEIEGLKSALATLSGEAFLQRSHRHSIRGSRVLRGVSLRAA